MWSGAHYGEILICLLRAELKQTKWPHSSSKCIRFIRAAVLTPKGENFIIKRLKIKNLNDRNTKSWLSPNASVTWIFHRRSIEWFDIHVCCGYLEKKAFLCSTIVCVFFVKFTPHAHFFIARQATYIIHTLPSCQSRFFKFFSWFSFH